MIKVGDYVGFQGEAYPKLRGIVLEGPRFAIMNSDRKVRVMWDTATTPPHWQLRPSGSWEIVSNIKVLSSLGTK